MATNAVSGSRIIQLEDITPAAQASTNSYAVVTDSNGTARAWQSISYTIKVITNSVDWTVHGANISDFSDEVIVNAESSVAAGATDSYAVTQAAYSYYRVKIKSTVADNAGTATVTGVMKSQG